MLIDAIDRIRVAGRMFGVLLQENAGDERHDRKEAKAEYNTGGNDLFRFHRNDLDPAVYNAFAMLLLYTLSVLVVNERIGSQGRCWLVTCVSTFGRVEFPLPFVNTV
jgi:hypothetical protein